MRAATGKWSIFWRWCSSTLGYLPFSPSGGTFHLLSKLYAQTSVIITTNLGFSAWAGVFVIAH